MLGIDRDLHDVPDDARTAPAVAIERLSGSVQRKLLLEPC
jgi:hypothetical protein